MATDLVPKDRKDQNMPARLRRLKFCFTHTMKIQKECLMFLDLGSSFFKQNDHRIISGLEYGW
jgi:hypothetical protein